MAKAIVMPKLAMNMTKGVITQWYVKEGDYVNIDDPVFALETDKITIDALAMAEGVVLKIVAQVGEEKLVAEPCCYVGEKGETI